MIVMVKVIYVKKKISDEKFEKYANGKHFGRKHFDRVIRDDTDCYWVDELGKKHILFKFRKNAITLGKSQVEKIRNIYEQFGKEGTNNIKTNSFKLTSNVSNKKTYTSGKPVIKIYTRSQRSKISGFYDRASIPNLIRNFNTTNVCRTTRFTRDHFDKWTEALPLFEKISNIYKRLAPTYYKKQILLFDKSPKGLRIGNTAFTTVTSNYNWRTACHKDKGDFSGGLGNLSILGDDTYTGGYLGFPQFKVAVDVRPLDVIIMDVHQWHCNTELKANEDNVRLSFVCYYRNNMLNCNRKGKYSETYYYKSMVNKRSTKKWFGFL